MIKQTWNWTTYYLFSFSAPFKKRNIYAKPLSSFQVAVSVGRTELLPICYLHCLYCLPSLSVCVYRDKALILCSYLMVIKGNVIFPCKLMSMNSDSENSMLHSDWFRYRSCLLVIVVIH